MTEHRDTVFVFLNIFFVGISHYRCLLSVRDHVTMSGFPSNRTKDCNRAIQIEIKIFKKNDAFIAYLVLEHVWGSTFCPFGVTRPVT